MSTLAGFGPGRSPALPPTALQGARPLCQIQLKVGKGPTPGLGQTHGPGLASGRSMAAGEVVIALARGAEICERVSLLRNSESSTSSHLPMRRHSGSQAPSA